MSKKTEVVAETAVELAGNRPADFAHFDWIVVSISGGKDSAAALDYTMQVVPRELHSRVVCVYADLGRVVWKGTKELAASHAKRFGLRFEVVTRSQNDLLDHVLAKRVTMDANGQTEAPSWPSVRNSRWCTSDHKRGPIFTVFTKLAAELGLDRKARILDVQGLRGEESGERKAMPQFKYRAEASNATKRDVWTWLPIHSWTLKMVKFRNSRSGLRMHEAYALGMTRLSCCFCIYGSDEEYVIAGRHNPELLDAYIDVEERTRFPLRQGRTPLKAIWLQLQSHNTQQEAA